LKVLYRHLPGGTVLRKQIGWNNNYTGRPEERFTNMLVHETGGKMERCSSKPSAKQSY
jgi:hypothetical protein